MFSERKSFRREAPEDRKEALIRATLRILAEAGPGGATVRAIADAAGMTQGMIRHYFSTKEELISAAFETHMRDMTEASGASLETGQDSAVARLAYFVTGGLTPPVVDPAAVSIWAGFLHAVRKDPDMRETHKRGYYFFRDRLETLIAGALSEAGRAGEPTRALAIACNAVLDGLWLEGGALPDAFADGELPAIGLRSVGAILGLDLGEFERDRQ
ncbi:MAG: TetR family transcriptional regulator C-terminal domain-containing protein [Albidovulum sp.]